MTPCKDGKVRFKTGPNLYLTNYVEDIVVFLCFKTSNFDNTYMLGILFIFGFKDTVVNRALSSLHGGQFKITLTVKSKMIFTLSLFKINCPTIAERDKCKYTGGPRKHGN